MPNTIPAASCETMHYPQPDTAKAGYFHDCPPDPACRHCTDRSAVPDSFDWSFLDGVYCISLQERPERTSAVAAQLHRVGLCRHVRFYRPARDDDDPVSGIWRSHREVARHALSKGQSRVLTLEDDVIFSRWASPRRVRSVADAIGSLPDGWWIFYLGHWPLKVRRIRRHIIATTSACTHAYVASPPLLTWLSQSEPQRIKTKGRWSGILGGGIDAAFTQLPGTYALFPMMVLQNTSPSDHLRRDKRGRVRRLRHLIGRTWVREYLQSWMMRPNEFLVFALSRLRSIVDYVSTPLVGT
ncbi:MAG TPA: hypothetical protein VGK20_16415 [Candidatus Binatia bacterium]